MKAAKNICLCAILAVIIFCLQVCKTNVFILFKFQNVKPNVFFSKNTDGRRCRNYTCPNTTFNVSNVNQIERTNALRYVFVMFNFENSNKSSLITLLNQYSISDNT